MKRLIILLAIALTAIAGQADDTSGKAWKYSDARELCIIDAVPNCNVEMCDTLTYNLVNTLWQAYPDVPIVIAERLIYTFAWQDKYFLDYQHRKMQPTGETAKSSRPRIMRTCNYNSVKLDGVENDGTIDGIHLINLGFRHYADKIGQYIEKS